MHSSLDLLLLFLQNTSFIREPQVISAGVHTPCTLPLDPPLVKAFHTELRKPNKPIRYKRVCEQNMFCYRDFRSYLKANHPKLLSSALKSTLAFEIHWMMLFLLRCLSLPSPSLRAELNFKSGFSLWRIFRCQIFPCEELQPVVEFGVLVLAVLFHLY